MSSADFEQVLADDCSVEVQRVDDSRPHEVYDVGTNLVTNGDGLDHTVREFTQNGDVQSAHELEDPSNYSNREHTV